MVSAIELPHAVFALIFSFLRFYEYIGAQIWKTHAPNGSEKSDKPKIKERNEANWAMEKERNQLS